RDAAYAVHRLDSAPQNAIGEIGRFTFAATRAHRHVHDRCGVRVDALDARLLDALRQFRDHTADAVAHLFRSFADWLFEVETRNDDAEAFVGARRQLIEPADRVELLFDRLRDLGLDLFGRSARQNGRDD